MHGALDRVDPHAAQRPEVDHEAVVDRAQTGAVVAAAAHGDREVVVARELTAAITSSTSAHAHDERRAPVDHAVVDRPRLVVVGVAGCYRATPQGARQGADRFLCKCSHASSSRTMSLKVCP